MPRKSAALAYHQLNGCPLPLARLLAADKPPARLLVLSAWGSKTARLAGAGRELKRHGWVLTARLPIHSHGCPTPGGQAWFFRPTHSDGRHTQLNFIDGITATLEPRPVPAALVRLALARASAEGERVIELGSRNSIFAEEACATGRQPILVPQTLDDYSALTGCLNFTPLLC